jgi:hypothetical protein
VTGVQTCALPICFYAEQKTEVHPQTLRAFVKERVEAGEEFPMELFGAWVGQRAVIKRGK